MFKDFELYYSDFKREYNIDLIDDEIALNKFFYLLRGLTFESNLKQVMNLRQTNKWDLHDYKLRELKDFYELEQKDEDELKQFALDIGGSNGR